MKLLFITSTINLKHRLGCTPAWWQLYKALYELDNDITVIPYLGVPVESLWWQTSRNPCTVESLFLNSILDNHNEFSNYNRLFSKFVNYSIKYYVKPKWKRYLNKYLNGQNGFDAVIFMNIPLNHISGIPSFINSEYGIPVVYYDGDMPTILPGYVEKREFKFNYYPGANIEEYNAFITNSKGVIPHLEEMGGHNLHTIHYGVDPDLYAPINLEKDIDIFYYGHGSQAREKRMNFMITEPSKILENTDFLVGGKDFNISLGNSKRYGVIPISEWRHYCARSKINLNITRNSHAEVYSSSTSRPFELASMGCCVVSDPYNGLENWFDLGKEMYMVEGAEEAVEIYEWLLDSDDERERTGELARKRVLKEHTFVHRGKELIDIIKNVKSD